MIVKPSLRQPTPRPWNIAPDLSHMDSLTTIEAEPVPFTNKWPRMIVQVGGTASVFEQEANTRLMACAPEFLDAGQRLIGAEANARAGDPEAQADFDRAMIDLRAAIDKATGA